MSTHRHLTGRDDLPGLYVITVEGVLDPDWSERIAGMQVTPVPGSAVPRTRLTGWLQDRASLHGVLATLNTLSVSIVSLERVRSDGDPDER